MRRLAIAAPVVALLLSACGSGQEIPVTNEGNVVLNREQANFAFTNDGEMPGNQEEVAANMAMENAADAAATNAAMGNAM